MMDGSGWSDAEERLFEAVRKDDAAEAKRWIQAGATGGVPLPESRKELWSMGGERPTALMAGLRCGSHAAVDVVLGSTDAAQKKGLVQGKGGWTEAEPASWCWTTGSFKKLWEAGARMDWVDESGSAFHRIARIGDWRAAKGLAERGAPLDALNRDGKSALAEAARWMRPGVTQELLKLGADPRAGIWPALLEAAFVAVGERECAEFRERGRKVAAALMGRGGVGCKDLTPSGLTILERVSRLMGSAAGKRLEDLEAEAKREWEAQEVKAACGRAKRRKAPGL